jgi:hypothetical protein
MLEPFGTFWFQKGVKGSGTLCEALVLEGSGQLSNYV